jgi:glycosyltransferase involved in cell wall biosynthesis
MREVNDLTVIIPCYNEEDSIYETILSVHKLLTRACLSFVVVVVDDGSTDNSMQQIQRASELAEIIHLPVNRGYGFAIKQGLKRAKSEWVAIIDADLTYHPDDLLSLWKEREGYDMVVGARTGEKVFIPWLRRPMKYILQKFAGWLVEYSIPDLNSGIRLFKTSEALRFFHLYPNRFSFTTTITMSFLSSALNVQYLPINYDKRKGTSKIRPLRDSYRFLVLILQIAVYYNPLKVFIPIALAFSCVAVLSILYDVFIIKNLADKSIFLSTLSIVTFLLGLIADLIIKRSPT